MTKEELKAKMEELKREMEELKAIETQVTKEESEMEFLKVRETKRILWNVMESLPLKNFKLSVAGFIVTVKPESKKVKIDSGITLEKNKTVERVSAKESFTAKVARLSGLHPDIHVTHSDLSYPKTAKAWLTKNFPEELAIS